MRAEASALGGAQLVPSVPLVAVIAQRCAIANHPPQRQGQLRLRGESRIRKDWLDVLGIVQHPELVPQRPKTLGFRSASNEFFEASRRILAQGFPHLKVVSVAS